MCAENIAIAIFLRCSAGIFTKAVGQDQFQFLLRKLIDINHAAHICKVFLVSVFVSVKVND